MDTFKIVVDFYHHLLESCSEQEIQELFLIAGSLTPADIQVLSLEDSDLNFMRMIRGIVSSFKEYGRVSSGISYEYLDSRFFNLTINGIELSNLKVIAEMYISFYNGPIEKDRSPRSDKLELLKSSISRNYGYLMIDGLVTGTDFFDDKIAQVNNELNLYSNGFEKKLSPIAAFIASQGELLSQNNGLFVIIPIGFYGERYVFVNGKLQPVFSS